MSDNITQLFIKPNAATNVQPARNYIYERLRNGNEVRRRTVGFSYFGEVGGLRTRPADGKYVLITLNRPTPQLPNDPQFDAQFTGTPIRMTYDEWFDLLESYGINMSRIFVYPDVEPQHYLFAMTAANNTKYNLSAPGTTYFTWLKKYVQLAAQRNIVVQITLAGVHTLRADRGWSFHPMNEVNNTAGILKAQPPLDGRDKFFVMRKPNDPAGTPEQKKNYEVQSRTLDWILDATSGSWNVIYELFNEPMPNLHPNDTREWLVTTAKWLDERLRSRCGGVRKHLIAMNAPDSFFYNTNPKLNILRQLLFGLQGRRLDNPLVDIVSFHGMQWGGPTLGAERPNETTGHPPCSETEIKNATYNAVNKFYNQELVFDNGTRQKVEGSRVALIMDSDGHYRAQDSPDVYGKVVMKQLKLDYNHRWHNFWLSHERLNQQLSELSSATVFSSATV